MRVPAYLITVFPVSATTAPVERAANDARRDAIHDTSLNWLFAGLCCSILGVVYAAFADAAPPTHRFIGKSPAYIKISWRKSVCMTHRKRKK